MKEEMNNPISAQFPVAAACGSEHGRRDVHWTARAMRAGSSSAVLQFNWMGAAAGALARRPTNMMCVTRRMGELAEHEQVKCEFTP